MAEKCPHLEYRALPDANTDQPRAYCIAADQFVQAMRADVCNDRYGLDHETDCEIFRDHEGLPVVPEVESTETDGDDRV